MTAEVFAQSQYPLLYISLFFFFFQGLLLYISLYIFQQDNRKLSPLISLLSYFWMDIGSGIPVISGASYPDWVGMQGACSYCVCLKNTCMCFLLTKPHLTHRIYHIIVLVTNEMKTAKLPHENKIQKQFITWHILIQNHHPYKRIIVTDIIRVIIH